MANGRYPFKSAWAFRRKGSGKFALLRNEVMTAQNNPEMWQNWFLGSDGIGFGIIKRWNGTEWVVSQNIKVRAF